VRVYFPHFMDVEYSQFFGRQRAAKLVDHYLKLLALLGARISMAAAILDGDSVQHLITDKKFREFITECDRGFLRLEASMERNLTRSDRERVARQQWHRIQNPGWVSSGRIETPAMVAAAEIALGTGFGDHDETARFEEQVKRIAKKFELSKEAHSILVNNFHLLSWYGISDQFVARLNPAPPATYYQKLLAALEAPNVSGEDYAALNRVKDYIDSRVHNTWQRSAVLRVLEADTTIDSRSRDEIRATVASAWTAAMSDGSSATVSLTIPLPVGVIVPRVLDEPTEAFVDMQQLGELIRGNPILRIQHTFPIDVVRLSWNDVIKLVENTEKTRVVVTSALDAGREVQQIAIDAHREALTREIQTKYPTATRWELTQFGISVVSATAADGSPIGYAGTAGAGLAVGNSMWRWARGRFLAGTLNRFADRLNLGERKA
jgi:hypothetical protein